MRLHETQDVQVRSLKYRCPSRQLSARMGEVCRHLPLSVLTPTLGQPGGGKFLVCCPLSVCLVYLHHLYRCRIPKWCLSAPDTSVGWEAFLSPVYQLEYEASHSICTQFLAASRHPAMYTGPGFSSSVLTCQKHLPSVLRVAQEIWEEAEMS